MFLQALKIELNQFCRQYTTDKGYRNGFTLLELIVVIALFSIMLVLTVPRFNDTLFNDETKKNSRWVIGKIQALKEAAIRNQKDYTLHIDLDGERFWETDESMSAEDLEKASLNANDLPAGLKIADIEFPTRGKINTGKTDISFYKKGYSDKAIIHIRDGESDISFLIEPFLSDVTRYETYVSFES
jgi:prepilin-type N-terminal cleavage/methylation domain-containing protein